MSKKTKKCPAITWLRKFIQPLNVFSFLFGFLPGVRWRLMEDCLLCPLAEAAPVWWSDMWCLGAGQTLAASPHIAQILHTSQH